MDTQLELVRGEHSLADDTRALLPQAGFDLEPWVLSG